MESGRAEDPQEAIRGFLDLYADAEMEVRHRLRRQPVVQPQFRVGVQVALRWLREAMAARVGEDLLDPRSIDDPRPG